MTTIPNFEEVKNFDDIAVHFAAAAKSIMLEHDLCFADNAWQITALELYLFTEQSGVWRDPFTHGRSEQLNSGTWYVHDDGSRSPNYSGIDITAGSRHRGIYAGLLIRELDEHDGSARALQTIIRGKYVSKRKGNVWTSHEKGTILTIHGGSILTSPLRLVPRLAARPSEALWCGPRWGLNPKNADGKVFANAPLRLATWQTKKHKEKMRRVEIK
jgi:hypothetical protein